MDQGPLVSEQINDGAKLASKFDKWKPLQAAFWLKGSEDGEWYLYLVSDQIDDTNFDVAYGEVHRLLGGGPHLWLDPFQVKVAGIEKPVAQEVIALKQKYPSLLPMRLRNQMLGGVYVAEVFIYPIPVPAAN